MASDAAVLALIRAVSGASGLELRDLREMRVCAGKNGFFIEDLHVTDAHLRAHSLQKKEVLAVLRKVTSHY